MRRRHQVRFGLAVAASLTLVASAACGASRSGGAAGGSADAAATPGRRALPDTTEVAYGTRSEGRRSGLTSRVTQVDIDRAGNMNLAAFIESRLSGVRVVTNRGDYAVYVSGASFQSQVGALIIIDGTEGSMAGLTLHDITTIEVLKDSAASIYGVRGANGVLLITTRKR